jgi:hypothetical protein
MVTAGNLLLNCSCTRFHDWIMMIMVTLAASTTIRYKSRRLEVCRKAACRRNFAATKNLSRTAAVGHVLSPGGEQRPNSASNDQLGHEQP